jgi:serine/threonine-protein kinase
MGIVVAATHLALGQLVALKFLLANRNVGREQLERFTREGRAAAFLKSAHVTRVLDVGQLPDGAPYTVMEYLEGRDLKAVLVESGPLPIDDAVEYVLHACEALGEAHAAGVVHRDIKPANLFLTMDVSRMPCVKIFDFGISKLANELTLTQDAASMGSPLYMSPEQLNSSHDVDGRADIWSLGASLFELLAGQTPFHADTIQQLCYRIVSGHPTPLSQLRPEVPAGLEAVIMQCLEKDRNRRFNTIAHLAAGLAPWAPPRAAAYPERVARVLNVQTQPARTTALLPEPRGEPLPAALQSDDASAPSPSTSGTMLLPVRSGMASSPVASTQDTVLTRSTPHDARTAGQPAARRAGERDSVRWRPVVTVGAVGVVVLAVSLGVRLRYAPKSTESAATSSTSLSLVAPAATSLPEVPGAATPAPPQPSIPVNEATSARPDAVPAPAVSASGPPASNAAHTVRQKPFPSSHEPVKPKPIATVSPRDTIE